MNIGEEFERILVDGARELGVSLGGSLADVRRFASERMLHLANIVDEPGYLEALRAERDKVALELALNVTDEADAADARLVGIISGALAIGARALAGPGGSAS